MRLGAGARLGHYEIISLLGSGGMGEVYRARDSRLHREVAIKVLQPALMNDADHLARFSREAQALAALNHPNIAHLHGIEEADGTRALVMELVEGPTLADRLTAGPIALDESLSIARQIVEALEAAHAAGIVHRDLKPANIKVRDDGTVKVLDFGLAKALDRESAAGAGATNSPTISIHATAAGIILGTAAYMSPEQVRGRPADKRADIWAFGAVVYEMLAGRRPFVADDISDTLAFVLTREPDWTAVPASTPVVIQRLLRRCLEKDRKKRLPDIGVARLDIDEALAAPAAVAATDSGGDPKPPHRWRWLIPFAAGAALALAAGGAVWMARRPLPASPPVTRLGITLPPEQALAISLNDRDLAVSPDGSHLVYSAGADAQLMVRALDRFESLPLGGIKNARAPFVSADGRWVGFFERLDEGLTTGPIGSGALRKVPLGGGPPAVITMITGASRGASWGEDDAIVFATSDPATGLLRVPAGGGQAEVLTTPAEGEDHHHPRVLPGGRGVLFTIVNRQPFATRVAILDLGTRQWRTLLASGSQAEYVGSGHLIYELGGALWAVAFDGTNLDVAGDPVAILEDLTRDTAAANLAVSRQGMLVYAPSAFITASNRALVWVDRQGREQPIGAPLRQYLFARLSPDGGRIAVSVNEGRTRQFGIWTWDVSVPEPTRLGDSFATFLAWSADGRYLVYNSGPQRPMVSSLSRRAVDGTGAAAVLTAGDQPMRVTAISSDGKRLVYEQQTAALSYDLMLLSLTELATASRARPAPLLNSSSDERNASISPDGRWMAYESNESGQFQVYVKPFPNVRDAQHQVSTEGGRTPVWSPDGRELFFVSRSSMMAAKVQTTPLFRTGASTRLFASGSLILDARLALGNTGRTFDVSRDGQRFLMIKDTSAETPRPSIIVVQNWFQELQAKVPAGK